MNNTQRNIASVQRVYEAFGRGDVPTILTLMRPDVDWEFGAGDHGIPWLAHRRGPEGVAGFFGAVAENLDFQRFEVMTILGEGDWVVALCAIECTVKSTGKTIVEACEPHIWRFDPEGRVAAFRHAADTFRQRQALDP